MGVAWGTVSRAIHSFKLQPHLRAGGGGAVQALVWMSKMERLACTGQQSHTCMSPKGSCEI